MTSRLYGVLEERVFIIYSVRLKPSSFNILSSTASSADIETEDGHSRSFGETSTRKTHKVCSHLLYSHRDRYTDFFFVLFILLQQHPLLKMLELAALMYYSEQVWTVKQN
jgi:hypothetical protein